jgi:Secretion system C-terminal sorting domain
MNFKPYFYMLLCVIINNSCIAQTYFNHFYTDLVASNIKSDSSIYLSTSVKVENGKLKISLVKIDERGDIFSNIPINIQSSGTQGLGVYFSSLSNKKKGKYLLAAMSDDSVLMYNTGAQRLNGRIMCINESFDSVLWQQTHNYLNDSTTRYLKCQWLTNSDIIIAGDIGVYNPTTQADNVRPILVRTDSLGNKRWERDFTQQVGYNLYFDDMAATPDGGFLLSATNLLFTGDNNDGLSAQAVLIKVDSAGNQQWRKIWGTPNKYDGHVQIHLMPDGTILTVNQKALNPPQLHYNSYWVWSTLHFRKWEANSTLISTKNMVQEFGAASEYTDIITRPNGNLGLVHHKYNYQIGANIYGYFEFTPALDSVKCRYFPNTFNPLPVYDWSVVGAMDNTTDGGLVFSGYHFCNNGCIVNPGQQAWVMKLDSNACEITDCYTPTESPPLGDLGGLRLYPNPANSDFTLQYSDFQNKQIIITDLLGRTQKTLSLQSETTNIPTQNLANGIYYLTLYHENNLIYTAKLVVQHE